MEVDESAVDMEVVRSVSFNGFLDVSLVEKDVTVDIKNGRLKVWAQTAMWLLLTANIFGKPFSCSWRMVAWM